MNQNAYDIIVLTLHFQEEGIPLSTDQVDHLIKYIDIDGDGDIDFR